MNRQGQLGLLVLVVVSIASCARRDDGIQGGRSIDPNEPSPVIDNHRQDTERNNAEATSTDKRIPSAIEGVWVVISKNDRGKRYSFLDGVVLEIVPTMGTRIGRYRESPSGKAEQSGEFDIQFPNEDKRLGIYSVEGESLTLCSNVSERPSDFSGGVGRRLVVLNRVRNSRTPNFVPDINESEAVAILEKKGAKIYMYPNGRASAVQWNCSGIDDKDLENVLSLYELLRLELSGTAVTDVGLKGLIVLDKLQYVFLLNTKVTEAGINEIEEDMPTTDFVTNARFMGLVKPIPIGIAVGPINDSRTKEPAKIAHETE